jgi:hypothetical protein
MLVEGRFTVPQSAVLIKKNIFLSKRGEQGTVYHASSRNDKHKKKKKKKEEEGKSIEIG